jgi:hypothetical protein
MSEVMRVVMIGVWSDDKSQLGCVSECEGENPEIMKKSSRSGIFLVSVGQYVGVPVVRTE